MIDSCGTVHTVVSLDAHTACFAHLLSHDNSKLWYICTKKQCFMTYFICINNEILYLKSVLPFMLKSLRF